MTKPFRWGGYTTAIGQEIQMSPSEGLAAVTSGRAIPVDVPEVAEYLCLKDITLPGATEAFRAKRLEKILLKRNQGIDLMLQKLIIPTDDARWRPYGMKLRQPHEERQERERTEALDKAAWENKLYQSGIHPAQKRK